VCYILRQSVTGSSILHLKKTKYFVLVRISWRPVKIFQLCMSSVHITGFVRVKATRAVWRLSLAQLRKIITTVWCLKAMCTVQLY